MIAHYVQPPAAHSRCLRPTTTWQEVPCPLCGSERTETILQGPSWDEGDERIYAVAQCHNCQIWYTNPVPENASTHGRRTGDSADAAPILNMLTAAPLHHLKAGQWLFHFGPAHFDLLHQARRRGWRVAIWRDQLSEVPQGWWLSEGSAVFGSLESLTNAYRGQVSVVTAFDWLERQTCLPGILACWRSLLMPRGLLILAVPNLDSAGFQKYGGLWRGLDLPHRRVHFSPETLSRFLTSHGWSIRGMRSYPCRAWLYESAQRWRQWQYRQPLSPWQRCRLAWRTSKLANTLTACLSSWLGTGDWLVVVCRPLHVR